MWKQMHLINIMHKWSQIQKSIYCMIPLIWSLKNRQNILMVKDIRMMINTREEETHVWKISWGSFWGSGNALYILILVKKLHGSCHRVENSSHCTPVSVYFSLCIPQENFWKHLSENKMIWKKSNSGKGFRTHRWKQEIAKLVLMQDITMVRGQFFRPLLQTQSEASDVFAFPGI